MEENKSFKNWRAQEVEEVFGIRRVFESPLLDIWLTSDPEVDDYKLITAERLRQELRVNVDSWNEAALKFFFIGPFVGLVGFNTQKYSGFLEQTLTVETQTGSARGNIDFMVATGREIPRSPYYLLHEYKPESTTVLDPKGQLLIGMLAAQRQNTAKGINIPIFGSYLIGRMWFFVILFEEEYVISDAFVATDSEDNLRMLKALLSVKKYIDSDFIDFAEVTKLPAA